VKAIKTRGGNIPLGIVIIQIVVVRHIGYRPSFMIDWVWYLQILCEQLQQKLTIEVYKLIIVYIVHSAKNQL